MTRKECFEILELAEGSGIADIKRAYRRLAFALHPDLHPELSDAGRRFQRLNEAYVLLLNDKIPKNYRYSGREGSPDSAKASGKASTGASREAPPGAASGSAYGGAQGGKADSREEVRRARHEAGKAYAKAKERFERTAGSFSPRQGEGAMGGAAAEDAKGSILNFRESKAREDVLRDILDDPFARRVFEDIYSHVRNEPGVGKRAGRGPLAQKVRPGQSMPTAIKKAPSLVESLASGMVGSVKGWLKGKIDDEQTITMPRSVLTPGAKVRIKIRHGLSGSRRTVDITLPPEFVPGQPLRLRGLGKHVGSLRGDLYLTLLPG